MQIIHDQVEDQPRDRESEDRERAIKSAIAKMVQRLEIEANSRVGKRNLVEKRWIEDLEQLHGEYDRETNTKLAAAKKSQLFINLTRPKTNGCSARIGDMLFPTDDRNWGIRPTPVPELAVGAKKIAAEQAKRADQANAALKQGQQQQAEQIVSESNEQLGKLGIQMKEEMEVAKTACDYMQEEIDDQLRACNYAAAARKVIEDASRIGTGVMKGPVGSMEHARRSWQKNAEGRFELGYVDEKRPAFYHVDPWAFFPSADATCVQESPDFYERHMWRDADLRKAAKQPGFDLDAIRALLREGANSSLPTYLADLRNITGEQQAPTEKMYQVWEYRGSITNDEIMALYYAAGKDEEAMKHAEIDPLIDIQVCLWFCQGKVLKFGIAHMDSGEPVYSVYNLEKDESSIWGYGIPYLMRDSQKAMNAAWRMMMDNSGLSSGPQIEIDPEVIRPADNTWELVPRKVWLRNSTAMPGKVGINTYDIPNHQAELAAIIEMAKQFVDDETSMSQIAQGEQGTHTTQTAQGMAILMNAINVIFRRFIKHFDDDVTVPNIRRLYDWNMQFSPKEHIKGDMEVDARGSSVLLVRELQSQNLMVVASNLTIHPKIGPMLKEREAARKLFQSMLIPPDDILKSEQELKEEAAKPPAPDLEMMKLQLQQEIEKNKLQAMLEIAQLENETRRLETAARLNLTLEQINAQLKGKQMELDSGERKQAVEIAVEAARPKDEGQGSGGWV
jgi:hypothetical protein